MMCSSVLAPRYQPIKSEEFANLNAPVAQNEELIVSDQIGSLWADRVPGGSIGQSGAITRDGVIAADVDALLAHAEIRRVSQIILT